jgi:hypothetical protein
MSCNVPAIATDCLNGRHEAADISDSATIAFWMHGRDEITCAYHLKIVHEKFAELAKVLGYTITPIAPAEAQTEEAA